MAAIPAVAQPGAGGRQGRMSQLENAKIAYITEKISLTQDQAQRFWPVYNEFTAKRRDLNRRMRETRTNDPDALSEAQVKESLTQALALRQQEVNLEKEYFDKFQKVLNIRQVGKLYQAERQFTKEVIRRVADHRGGPPTTPGTSD
ncbi:Spy/CpxP family protein refolding chaperone [Hymenobacter telluris]|uniref:Spy/CpxP family protein refolding chaperone n=1 Tax=Hymenobacter telluris TaxID=2816474 RepID=UPI001A8DFD15|nr:Spy/CpxP family protein refolding chaperone [Hymenobacter telluris]